MTVQELWDRTWGTIQTLEKANLDFITAVNEATEHLFQYLWTRKAPICTDLFAISYFEPLEDSAQNDLLSGADAPLLAVRELRTDFRGLAERPFVSGQTIPLEPVTEDQRIALASKTGMPTHYELRENKLYVWPLPEESTIVRGLYFKHPGTIAGYSDALPYYGIFDLVYRSLVLALVELGVTADLTAILETQAGDILSVRDYHSPSRTVIQDF